MITQISYEYRVGMLKGTDSFKSTLNENYNVHARPIWMPAAGGNYEMWFDIFISSGLLDFLKSAIVGGATYEIARHTVFKPFIDALENLNKENDYSLEIQKYRFFFEDTKVVVYGLANNFTSIFSGIFKEIFNTYEEIKKASEDNEISELRIPVDKESGRNEWWVGPEELAPYLTYWGISIQYGLDHFIWDVQNREIIS